MMTRAWLLDMGGRLAVQVSLLRPLVMRREKSDQVMGRGNHVIRKHVSLALSEEEAVEVRTGTAREGSVQGVVGRSGVPVLASSESSPRRPTCR